MVRSCSLRGCAALQGIYRVFCRCIHCTLRSDYFFSFWILLWRLWHKNFNAQSVKLHCYWFCIYVFNFIFLSILLFESSHKILLCQYLITWVNCIFLLKIQHYIVSMYWFHAINQLPKYYNLILSWFLRSYVFVLQEAVAIGVDSLGFDLRICSGRQVQTLRFSFDTQVSFCFSKFQFFLFFLGYFCYQNFVKMDFITRSSKKK